MFLSVFKLEFYQKLNINNCWIKRDIEIKQKAWKKITSTFEKSNASVWNRRLFRTGYRRQCAYWLFVQSHVLFHGELELTMTESVKSDRFSISINRTHWFKGIRFLLQCVSKNFQDIQSQWHNQLAVASSNQTDGASARNRRRDVETSGVMHFFDHQLGGRLVMRRDYDVAVDAPSQNFCHRIFVRVPEFDFMLETGIRFQYLTGGF